MRSWWLVFLFFINNLFVGFSSSWICLWEELDPSNRSSLCLLWKNSVSLCILHTRIGLWHRYLRTETTDGCLLHVPGIEACDTIGHSYHWCSCTMLWKRRRRVTGPGVLCIRRLKCRGKPTEIKCCYALVYPVLIECYYCSIIGLVLTCWFIIYVAESFTLNDILGFCAVPFC